MSLMETSDSSGDAADAFAARTVANRLIGMFRSMRWYDLLSNGVQEDVMRVLPGGAEQIKKLDDDQIAAAWSEVVGILRERRLEPVLSLHGVPFPRYPIGEAARQSNGGSAPPVAMWDPPHLPAAPTGGWTVLGFDVGFPIGIPSCDLTANAEWIEFYARKGFQILTYRTVRNEPRAGSDYEWVYVAGISEPWSGEDTPTEVRHAEGTIPPDVRRISTATSYLAPCLPPNEWEEDIRDARCRLDDLDGNHVLIVSVTDSVAINEKSIPRLSADFVDVARRAEAAGADAIECYLARSTTVDRNGELKRCERDVETSVAIVTAVRGALKKETKLVIKLSATLSDESLEQVVTTLARDHLIDGVSGISPIEVERITTGPNGHPLWANGSPRTRRPAVAGYALRDRSQEFVRRLASIRCRNNLEFDIIAMGGIMTPQDVAIYMDLGAAAVQTATAAVFDPDLADAAYAHYRKSVQTEEVWEGFVTDVEPSGASFSARVTATGAQSSPDMEAEFDANEVPRHERGSIRPGAYFRWTTGLVEEGGRPVRKSSVDFYSPNPPSEEAVEAGRDLAERVAAVFGPPPDIG